MIHWSWVPSGASQEIETVPPPRFADNFPTYPSRHTQQFFPSRWAGLQFTHRMMIRGKRVEFPAPFWMRQEGYFKNGPFSARVTRDEFL